MTPLEVKLSVSGFTKEQKQIVRKIVATEILNVLDFEPKFQKQKWLKKYDKVKHVSYVGAKQKTTL